LQHLGFCLICWQCLLFI